MSATEQDQCISLQWWLVMLSDAHMFFNPVRNGCQTALVIEYMHSMRVYQLFK